jgi:hypothetical protein
MSAPQITSPCDSTITRIAHSREGRHEEATRGSLARLTDHSLPAFLPSAPKPKERFRPAPPGARPLSAVATILRHPARTFAFLDVETCKIGPYTRTLGDGLLFRAENPDQITAHGS